MKTRKNKKLTIVLTAFCIVLAMNKQWKSLSEKAERNVHFMYQFRQFADVLSDDYKQIKTQIGQNVDNLS